MKLFSGDRREVYCLLSLLFSSAAGVIWIRTATVKDTYRYVQQEKEFRKVQQEIQASRVKWLKLTSPKRLETLAQRLELYPPRMQQILKYEPEKGASANVANASPR